LIRRGDCDGAQIRDERRDRNDNAHEDDVVEGLTQPSMEEATRRLKQ
jgi:hypothetical protein